MNTDANDTYNHLPVNGLPASLITLRGKTISAIALMAKAGVLNRKHREKLQAGVAVHDALSKAILAAAPTDDRGILSYYLNPAQRNSAFWKEVKVIADPQARRVVLAFEAAIDVQLLKAYEPNWLNLPLDADVLVTACPEWPRIKEQIEPFWKDNKGKIPLGMFMLWPRLLEDLTWWNDLDPEKQTAVGRAIFALSSIGRTHWFIDEALARCPGLEGELGALSSSAKPELKDVEPTPDQDNRQVNTAGSSDHGEVASDPLVDLAASWAALGEELTRLQADWQDEPTRVLLGRLALLGQEATDLLTAMPEEAVAPLDLLEEALAALRVQLLDATQDEALSWIGSEEIEQVMARWSLAAVDAADDDVVREVADDAERALERIAAATGDMRAAHALVQETQHTADVLSAELANQSSMVRRIELTRRLVQVQQDALDAVGKHADVMLFVLASASPKGEAFDPAIDYMAEMAGSALGEPEDATTQNADVAPNELAPALPAAEPEVTETAVAMQPVDAAPRLPAVAEAELEASATENGTTNPKSSAEVMSLEQVAVVAQPQTPANATHTIRNAIFTDAAVGDRCRTVWSLLSQGKPALAYQFAMTMRAAAPELRVPPPELLRAVSLAPGLVASDGPLAISISEAFAEIEAGWFEPGDAPSSWHTALNLLLIAATLRPMVLAPAMGAAGIAGHRHLDGRHGAMLELVRKVSEISEPLTGFTIGPTVLRSAADEVSQKAQLAKLSKDAEDWLYGRAPNKKIRYAPASKVWLHWLKPGEAIHKLISPVVRGALDERSAVRAEIEKLSDYNAFLERLRFTDRHELRRRGQDIEAGALDHLWTATGEAVALAKGWLGAANMLADSGGRLRVLVRQLQAAFDAHAGPARAELEASWDGDEWGQVAAASNVLRAELVAVTGLFKQSDAVPMAEPQAREMLARDLLWVPGTSIGAGWIVESDGETVLQALETWSAAPVDTSGAFDARLKAGDLAGAEILLPHLFGSGENSIRSQEIDKAKDLWIKDLQHSVQLARRASEVGLAYGYLSDAERAACESELSAVELGLRETGRYDEAVRRVKVVVARIDEQKARRVEDARREFEREKAALSNDVARQVEEPLARSDIHTFNELLQRVRQGAEPWPERDLRRDAFREFHPRLQAELQSHLVKLGAGEVDKLMRSGGAIGALSFDLDSDEQARLEAGQIYGTWVASSSRRSMTRDSLRKILEAVGVPVRNLDQDRVNPQSWALQSTPIDDREICPVPHFGSRAQGRYRVLVLGERFTPDDFLQRLGNDTQQTATIVVLLSRNQQRFWPDLARQAKERQRSFLLLDESMLLFLLAQRGSRLSTWFGIALPFTYSEPYDASAGFVPPEMFYGRTSELENVKTQGGCYFIYGGRQLGKTALLRRAERTFHDPSADRYAVWIDLLAQGIGERRPASDVWQSLADKLRELRITGLELPSINPGKPASINVFLGAIKSFLAAKPGRRILLLLDEADHFFEQDGRQSSAYAETRRLKQLMDETERCFKVVFAGLHNVLRTASTSNQPLGHLNEAVRIGPLMDEREIRAAEELITRPIEAAGFEFEDRSLVMRVLAQTNYYPSLIQLYCTQLLRHLRETKLRRQNIAGPRFKINESDIESVFAGRPLRDAIRSKFRLTLQLDDRYEVIANAIGLEALELGFDHAEGIDWRTIRQDCTSSWWPEGFATTTERDFLALLEEMVQLGVLSQAQTPDRFSLRNPNVLLLLGSKQEIEDTLQAEREPRIEFESTIFRPALSGRVDNPARNPLTYRQLDEVVQMRSSVLLVAASEAAGGSNLVPGLRDQPGMADTRQFVQLDRATDKRAFTQEFDKAVTKRVADGVTVMLVPPTVPWDAEWVTAARAKLNALRSTTSFVSVVFAADPQRLWDLVVAAPDRAEPWLSVLPWTRGFVRKWLEELQFPTDAVDRLQSLTGFWGGLLESAARVKGGALDFANNLDRMSRQIDAPQWRSEMRRRLTGDVAEAEKVLAAMLRAGDGVSESDLVEYEGLSVNVVERTLRWAEPLGLVLRQAGPTWSLDPFVKKMLEGA